VLVLTFVLPARAEYPDRPLTIEAGYPAGGMVDMVARALAEGMKKKFPKGIAVVNRPGGGGSLAMAEVAQARPDGYTTVLAPISTLVIHPQLNDLPYKTPDDYIAVFNTVSYYPLIVVRADAPWKTIKDLLEYAKANPGKVRVGSPGEGTSSHINLEELKRLTGTNLTHVPFGGWAESSAALLGGHIEAVVAQPGEARPQVDGKKMRALVAFHPRRHPAFPDAPTARELGWDVSFGILYMLIVPKGTPAPVQKYLLDAGKPAVEDPAFVNAMKARAVDVDYREGDPLKADVWKEYKLHTEILRRIGMIKK
jgi:tripartite-type tricarboxylate transporter receptor subunit TctC